MVVVSIWASKRKFKAINYSSGIRFFFLFLQCRVSYNTQWLVFANTGLVKFSRDDPYECDQV